jgi:hypothetical protein
MKKGECLYVWQDDDGTTHGVSNFTEIPTGQFFVLLDYNEIAVCTETSRVKGNKRYEKR